MKMPLCCILHPKRRCSECEISTLCLEHIDYAWHKFDWQYCYIAGCLRRMCPKCQPFLSRIFLLDVYCKEHKRQTWISMTRIFLTRFMLLKL